MPSEMIDEYEIEFEGIHLPEHAGWGAYVAIYGPSKNPMHRNPIVPTHHVSVETVFSTQQAAEAAAYQIALALLSEHRPPPLQG